jgi:hypothetical protein
VQAKEMEDLNLEVFPYRKGEPAISVNSQHKISFNKGAWFALGKPESVLLKFDPEKKVMGIEPCRGADRRAFPVKRHNANNAYTYAKPFLEHYGLVVRKTARYDAEMVGGELIVAVGG